MPYAWNAELETGHAIIDNQHRQLLEKLNALSEACEKGKGRHEVENTMEFLLAYTVKHFADEEELQKKYNYPEYFAHKRLHDTFKSTVQELAQKISQEAPTDEFVIKVYIIAGEWLFNHIMNEDLRMATYVLAVARLKVKSNRKGSPGKSAHDSKTPKN